jgi:hypothetical protein
LPAIADAAPLPLLITITPPVTVTFPLNIVEYEYRVPSTVTFPLTTPPTSRHVWPDGTSKVPEIAGPYIVWVVHVVVAAKTGARLSAAKMISFFNVFSFQIDFVLMAGPFLARQRTQF